MLILYILYFFLLGNIITKQHKDFDHKIHICHSSYFITIFVVVVVVAVVVVIIISEEGSLQDIKAT